MIQETKFNTQLRKDNFQYKWTKLYNNSMFINDSAENKKGGVAILIKNTVPIKNIEISHQYTVPQRYLVIKGEINKQTIFLHNVYAPITHAERPTFYSNLPTNFPENSIHIIAGDFNTILNPQLDSYKPNDSIIQGSTELRIWLNHLLVIDSWRSTHPLDKGTTSPTRQNRLDYIFLSIELNQIIQNVYTQPNISHADHLGVIVQLRDYNYKQGKGYWKTPTWILQSEETQQTLKKLLNTFINNNLKDQNLQKSYRLLKQEVRKTLQRIHKVQISKENNKLKQMFHSLEKALIQHQLQPNDQSKEHIKEKKNLLKTYKTEYIKRKQNTNFQKIFNETEKNTRFFFQRGKNRLSNKKQHIQSVILDDQTISNEQYEIEKQHIKYWEQTFKTNLETQNQHNSTLLNNVENTLNENDKQYIDQDITQTDIIEAINHLTKNKTPGKDGLSAEVFQLHPELWAIILEKVYSKSIFQENRIYDSQNMAVLNLIFKKNDPNLPKNYRPIALLNIDIKILTKILSYRLNQIIHKIIHPDQTGFIKNRFITDHIIRYESIKYHHKLTNTNGYAAILDFEKAYDRVEIHYLIKVLQKFNFGNKFIQIIKTIYSQPRQQLLINGYLSKPFYSTRGVRQGDPLSPLLFILAIEPLACLLRKNNQLGISIPNSNNQKDITFLFADDTTVLSSSLQNLDKIIQLIEQYGKTSGAKLNIEKSVIIKLNPKDETSIIPSNLQISNTKLLKENEFIQILGITQSFNISKETQLQIIFEHFCSRLIQWQKFARTFEGRITIIKTMALSTLYYIAQVLPFDKILTKKIIKYTKAFIKDCYITENGIDKKFNQLNDLWLHTEKNQGGIAINRIESIFSKFEIKLLCKIMTWATNKNNYNNKLWLWVQVNWNHNDYIQNHQIQWWDITLNRNIIWKNINPEYIPILKHWTTLKKHKVLKTKDIHEKNKIIQETPVWFLKYNGTNLMNKFFRKETRQKHEKLAQHGFTQIKHFLTENNQVTTTWQLYNNKQYNGISYNTRSWIAITNYIRQIKNYLEKIITIDVNILAPSMWTIVYKETQFFINNLTKTNIKHIQNIIQPPKTNPKTPPYLLPPDNDYPWNQEFQLRKLLTPKVADVNKRLQWKNLTLNYRLQWTKETNKMNCTYKCNTLETFLHAFWTCHHIQQIWNTVLPEFNQLLSRDIDWYDIIYINRTEFNENLQDVKQQLKEIWYILKCIIIHEIWTARNHILFKNIQLESTQDYTNNQIQLINNINTHMQLHMKLWKKQQDKSTLQHLFKKLQQTKTIHQLVFEVKNKTDL